MFKKLILCMIAIMFASCANKMNDQEKALRSQLNFSEFRSLIEPASAKQNYAQTLCKADSEQIGFSCKLAKKKIVSVCLSKDAGESGGYIVYRFGPSADKVELTFPADADNSFSQFHFESFLRGGGAGNAGLDLNTLSFQNGGFTYEVFDEFVAEEGKATRTMGVLAKDKDGKQIFQDTCSNDIVNSIGLFKSLNLPE